MPTLVPSITNAAGERLGARLDLPLEGRPLAYAIFAHCFTCTKNIKAAARHPKSFVSLDTADHLLSDQRDSWYAGEVIAAWASGWLQPAAK
jgi:hypothetical protein